MVVKKTAAKNASTAKAKKTAPATEGESPENDAVAPEGAPARKRAAGEKKTPAKKAAGVPVAGKTSVQEAPARKAAAAKKTGDRTVVAKKTAARAAAPEASAVPAARVAADPGELAVRPGEEPWSAAEVDEARSELNAEVERLHAEIATSEAAVQGLLRDSGGGAGDDDADTGTKNITREHEMALAGNAREMLLQAEHALERLDEGTYGLCEVCGTPIGKARMQAFPRATLCLDDKQRQERR